MHLPVDRIVLASAIAAAGCGSSAIKCDKTDRGGTYLMHMDERPNGGCGPLQDSVVNPAAPNSGGCQVLSESWSDNQCDYDSVVRCNDRANDLQMDLTGSVEQKDEKGDRLEGVATITLRQLSTGLLLCTSTYDVTYERQ